MMYRWGIFSISVLAVFAANSAFGALASKGYVDDYKLDIIQGIEKANQVVMTGALGKVGTGLIKEIHIEDNAVTADKLADDAKYVLPVATDTTLGGVKSGGDISVDSDKNSATYGQMKIADSAGVITTSNIEEKVTGIVVTPMGHKVEWSDYAVVADQAKADENDENIIDTYARKDALNVTDADATGDANGYVTSVTQSNGKIAVTKSQIKIPVGSADAAPSALIWVE